MTTRTELTARIRAAHFLIRALIRDVILDLFAISFFALFPLFGVVVLFYFLLQAYRQIREDSSGARGWQHEVSLGR